LKKLLLMAFVSALIASCSYSLVGRGSSLPPGLRSISIPLFVNKTGQPDLDTIVTTAVKNEFIRDGRLKVDDSPEADSELTGEIVGYGLQPVAFDSSNIATDYAVSLTLNVTHTETSTGKTLVKQSVAVNWRYVSSGVITSAESQRVLATEEAAKRAAESLVSLVIEAF